MAIILNTTDEILGALEKGNLSKDFAQNFSEVLQACRDHEGKGSITLKLAVAAKGDMVTIKAKIDTVIPREERRSSNFFSTADGRLSLTHPDQIDMEFASARRHAVDA